MFSTYCSFRLALFLPLFLVVTGCAVSSQSGTACIDQPLQSQEKNVSGMTPAMSVCHRTDASANATVAEPSLLDIEYGQERPVIDGIGNVLGIPNKLMLWDRRADNHRVSEQTVGEVAGYLSDHNLTDVKVRVNQYAPLEEWQRLTANKRIGAGWRYTFGVLKHLEYTLLPGRIWGGDEYNPYTNSVYLYSDASPLGLVESAYAKDVHQREFPGTYAVAQEFPIVSLWHESLATREAMHYTTLCSTVENLEQTRRLLYARYGMQVGGEFLNFGPTRGVIIGNVGEVIGALGGHVAANIETLREMNQPAMSQQVTNRVGR